MGHGLRALPLTALPRGRVRACARGRASLVPLSHLALAWGRLRGGRVHLDAEHRLLVVSGMRGGFGRGGTTVGAVFLTGRHECGPALLRHEAVHAEQWSRHGLGFAARYLAEELRHRGAANRFEREAGLADGGYAG